MFVFYDGPFPHVYFAKNVTNIIIPLKTFISPEWIYPIAKQTENNKLTNLTININSQHYTA